MRFCMYDDAHAGQQFVSVMPKQSWFKRWVVRPLKAMFVKAPCAVGNWILGGLKALWYDNSVMTLRWKLYENFWGTPFHKFCTTLITAAVVGVYFVSPAAFAMALVTIGCILMYLAFGLTTAGADAWKAQEMEHLGHRANEIKVAASYVDVKLAKEKAQVKWLQKAAQEETKRIEAAETKRLNDKFNFATLTDNQLHQILAGDIDGEIIL